MKELRGIGASKGIVVGKVLIMNKQSIKIDKKPIQSLSREVERLENAIKEAIGQLKELEKHALEHIGESESLIFEVHQMMISDKDFMDRIISTIENELVNVEYAVERVGNEYYTLFSEMDDPYMKERAMDIKDISKRLIGILSNEKKQTFSSLETPVIIAAKDLLPSDTVQMDKKNIIGFITQEGSRVSHSSILARTMQIPAIVGIKNLFAEIKDKDEVILDGESGRILINPNDNIKNQWLDKQKKYKKRIESLKKLKGTKSITQDGVTIQIKANIGAVEDVEAVVNNDAEGIGLFRSEFLYMNSDHMPTEEEQFKTYKTVLEKMEDKPVTIRTLDVGGDKGISYLQIPKEDNPFLGYRGIRISLDKIELFKIQIRALLRASIYGRLRIMFPMISTLEEVKKVKNVLEAVKKELSYETILFSDDIEIGIMIETPAAAMISDILAKEVDFFSIGTNDLTQYTIAVDRMNASVATLYDTHHLGVLRLIQTTIRNAHKEQIKVSICGEAAADLSLINVFVAMGVDELSVNAGSILETRQCIQNINAKEEGRKLSI